VAIPRRRDLRADALGVLLAAPDGIDGTGLQDAVAELSGRRPTASDLLACLLKLERQRFLVVERRDGHCFRLSETGMTEACEQGRGQVVDVIVVMLDLVGFVSFTEEAGDGAAHEQARHLVQCADRELRASGGRVLKGLGDGILGMVPPGTDALEAVRRTARVVSDAGVEWRLRAAAHHGAPILRSGDLFGRDVNLAARLCALAGPGEVVITVDGNSDGHGASTDDIELVAVRGRTDPVPVRRFAL
jgi:class 3 adenylate cyclase